MLRGRLCVIVRRDIIGRTAIVPQPCSRGLWAHCRRVPLKRVGMLGEAGIFASTNMLGQRGMHGGVMCLMRVC